MGQLVASVVDGHASVWFTAVSFGSDHEWFGEGENGASQLVAKHLAAVSRQRLS